VRSLAPSDNLGYAVTRGVRARDIGVGNVADRKCPA
jgi:hypothetical protein